MDIQYEKLPKDKTYHSKSETMAPDNLTREELLHDYVNLSSRPPVLVIQAGIYIIYIMPNITFLDILFTHFAFFGIR